jgi:hypothetical protein
MAWLGGSPRSFPIGYVCADCIGPMAGFLIFNVWNTFELPAIDFPARLAAWLLFPNSLVAT